MNDSERPAPMPGTVTSDTRGRGGVNRGLCRMIREHRRLRRKKGLSAANPAEWGRFGASRRSVHPPETYAARGG